MFNNPMEFLMQYNKFKDSMKGKNPKEVLDNMIKSGQVTQEQVKQAQNMAEKFASLLK